MNQLRIIDAVTREVSKEMQRENVAYWSAWYGKWMVKGQCTIDGIVAATIRSLERRGSQII